MGNLVKKLGLGAALAVTALSAAAPADAQYYRGGGYRGGYHGGYHGRGGSFAGGALVGGLLGLGVGAAIADSHRGGYYGYDRGYYGPGYGGYYGPPRGYYRDYYQPACWTQFRYDPYYGRVPVQVCR